MLGFIVISRASSEGFTYNHQMNTTPYGGPHHHTPHHYVHQKLKSEVNNSHRYCGNKMVH